MALSKRTSLILWLASTGPFACICSAVTPALSIDQSLELKVPTDPQCSPDGRMVIYEQSRTNWADNAFETDLWIVDVASGASHPLTAPLKSSSNAAWSPDGKWIAFLSDRPGQLTGSPAEKKQLYIIQATGGEARQLTKSETCIASLEWAPDSRALAFSAEDPEPKMLKERKEKYGDYFIVHGDYRMVHLWTVAVPAEATTQPMAEPKRVTEGDTFSVGEFSYSPDGKKIAFNAQRDPELRSAITSDIYVVDLSTKEVKKLVDTPGPDVNPKWSPDGKEVAYQTSLGTPFRSYTNKVIAVVSSAGGTPPVVLTQSFDEDARLVAWGPDGIYFAAAQKTYAHLFRLNPKTKAVEQLSSPSNVVANAFSFSKDFQKVAYRSARDNTFVEVCISSVNTWKDAPLTHFSDQLKAVAVSHRELLQWKSSDGASIEGVLYKPTDFTSTKKYPLLVVIHGGPTGVDQAITAPDRYYPIERFIEKGALVLRPNYRGSAGYGEKFRALNVRNLGVGDYADVISGVDALISAGYVDPARVGVMGWSQGGYISAFISASSDRFKAISVGAGISD